jgi:hypothetical protein
MNKLNMFIMDTKDFGEHKLILVSKEIKGIPAITLFYLKLVKKHDIDMLELVLRNGKVLIS